MHVEEIPGDTQIDIFAPNGELWLTAINKINELVQAVNGLADLANKQNRVLQSTADHVSCLENGIIPD